MKPTPTRPRAEPPDSAWLATEPAPLGPEAGADEPTPTTSASLPLHPVQPLHTAPPLRRRGTGLGAARATATASPSRPGPFDALLDGLDIQELDSQTLFDRFFGPPASAPPER